VTKKSKIGINFVLIKISNNNTKLPTVLDRLPQSMSKQ